MEGLVFDMGDVLLDATLWRRWLLEQLRTLGLKSQYRSLFAIWDREYLDDVHRGRRRYSEAFTAFLAASGLTPSQVDEVVAASDSCKRELEAETRPFPGVRQTLLRLHADGVRMAVLSDSESPSAAIARRLESLGIGAYFSAIVSSRDLGETKPQRACYLRAAAELHLSSDRLAFVGHDAEELLGARRAGMRTIAFNYERDTAADRYLNRFDELLQVVPAASRRGLRNEAA
ncbi:MAG: HAD family hydrolase [Pirellulales bacterium]